MDELELKPVMRQHQAAACQQSPLQNNPTQMALLSILQGKNCRFGCKALSPALTLV